MKILVLLFLFMLAAPALHAAVPPTAAEIIQKEGQLAFTDGSSFYVFNKDGTFRSGPMGISGRTIDGRWTSQGADFVVQGLWSWVNGLSAMNDYRKMILSIYPEGMATKGKSASGMMGAPATMYSCYFLIQELFKVPKPDLRGALSH